MSTLQNATRSTVHARTRYAVSLASAMSVALGALALAPPASAAGGEQNGQAQASAFWPTPDDEVVLPSRVAVAVERLQASVDRSVERVDERRFKAARRSLRAVNDNLARAHKAGMAQLNAVPPPSEEEEGTTAGPDSVGAVLTLDQGTIINLAGLFDGIQKHERVVAKLDRALTLADTNRNTMLDAVIALDPEEEGAAYADGLADSVAGYADEVSNVGEALAQDQLSPSGRTALQQTLKRSNATSAKVTAAFGGGE